MCRGFFQAENLFEPKMFFLGDLGITLPARGLNVGGEYRRQVHRPGRIASSPVTPQSFYTLRDVAKTITKTAGETGCVWGARGAKLWQGLAGLGIPNLADDAPFHDQ